MSALPGNRYLKAQLDPGLSALDSKRSNDFWTFGKDTNSTRGRARSHSIAIPKNRQTNIYHGKQQEEIQNAMELEELKQRYDLDTWKMFRRITEYRQRIAAKARPKSYESFGTALSAKTETKSILEGEDVSEEIVWGFSKYTEKDYNELEEEQEEHYYDGEIFELEI